MKAVAGKRFVRSTGALDDAEQLAETGSLHREPDAMQDEPGRLLSDPQGAGQLATADAVLGVGDAPHGHEPRRQRERGIFKDRSDLGAELLPARLAAQKAARHNAADLVAAARGTDDLSVRPLEVDHVQVENLRVGEMLHGIDQSLRAFFVHHSSPQRFFGFAIPRQFFLCLWTNGIAFDAVDRCFESIAKRVDFIALSAAFVFVKTPPFRIGGQLDFRFHDSSQVNAKVNRLANDTVSECVILNRVKTVHYSVC